LIFKNFDIGGLVREKSSNTVKSIKFDVRRALLHQNHIRETGSINLLLNAEIG